MKYRNKKEKLRQERGDAVAATYECWVDMRRRIRHPKGRNKCYSGLSIALEWNDFEMFLKSMGPRPIGMSIDRIDNSKGYEPSNCRWAGDLLQSRNRIGFVKIDMKKAAEIRKRYSYGGITQQELADEYGVTQPLIGYIVRKELWIEEVTSNG